MIDVIPALVPPPAPLQQLISDPIDPVVLLPDRGGSVVYGLAVVADGGRIADKNVAAALGWGSGTRVDLSAAEHGALFALPDPQGAITVNPKGYLRIPYRLRRRVNLFLGDAVLLAAYPDCERLAVYPPGALHTLLEPSRTKLLGGVRR
ncbi:AbrB/MazE/SpoVT family DNA-binding domain-containing protein [Nocardia uniformis]|uniref:AbrB/MazE/SpoVT family DNA-binding domain-containing protein n=1 Tax=Nocardia uniformis TaxID=53432 RepID=A0A849CID5_9NOCA|nr:AbrB/MazE/SpoVT family DNA-binding domain-containing protein [Nocardia uniformis]NNH76029.1 AbrB/MazE/SpoVT family DNA-binding domain-containing protein [Nocardia uniformis]